MQENARKMDTVEAGLWHVSSMERESFSYFKKCLFSNKIYITTYITLFHLHEWNIGLLRKRKKKKSYETKMCKLESKTPYEPTPKDSHLVLSMTNKLF